LAFDDSGGAYIAPGWTSKLILDGAIPPLTNAQVASNSHRNFQIGMALLRKMRGRIHSVNPVW
jgi:hypothetical protein